MKINDWALIEIKLYNDKENISLKKSSFKKFSI